MDAKDMKLWHGKVSEHWMNHQRGRKGEKGCPSPATSFISGGGGGNGAVALGVSGALAQERGRVEAKGRKRERCSSFIRGRGSGRVRRPAPLP
jgi:hypothetical protein